MGKTKKRPVSSSPQPATAGRAGKGLGAAPSFAGTSASATTGKARNDFYVYALIDPRTGAAFYIGKGRGKRAWTHLGRSAHHNVHRSRRVAEIRQSGLEPTVFMLHEGLTEDKALEAERELIQADRASLTNIIGGNKHSEARSIQTARSALKQLLRIKSEAAIRREGDIRLRSGEVVPLHRRMEVWRGCVVDLLSVARVSLEQAGVRI